jgi:DNA-binding winged helix-turn-helix (wHTH) protein
VIISFEGVDVDLLRSGVWRDRRMHPLAPRALEALVYLIDQRGRVVPVDELRERVFGGGDVREAAVVQALHQARSALGAGADGSERIEAVYGHGYRFKPQQIVRVWANATGSDLMPVFDPVPPPAPIDPRTLARQSLDSALAGRVQTLLLCGAKAAELSGELREAARARGATVVSARCSARPLAAWRRIARELGLPPGVEALEPGANRLAALERFARELRARAGSRGLVLALDDLHAADPDTMALAELVAAPLERAPLLLLGTYDESGLAAGELEPALGRLVRETAARVVEAA